MPTLPVPGAGSPQGNCAGNGGTKAAGPNQSKAGGYKTPLYPEHQHMLGINFLFLSFSSSKFCLQLLWLRSDDNYDTFSTEKYAERNHPITRKAERHRSQGSGLPQPIPGGWERSAEPRGPRAQPAQLGYAMRLWPCHELGGEARGAHCPLRVRTQVQHYKGALIPPKLKRLWSKHVIKPNNTGQHSSRAHQTAPRTPGLPSCAALSGAQSRLRGYVLHTLEILQHCASHTSSAAPVTKRSVAYQAAVTLQGFPIETEEQISHRSSQARRLTAAPEAAARGGAPGQLPAARTAPDRTQPRSVRRRTARPRLRGTAAERPPLAGPGPPREAATGARLRSAPALPAARPRPAAARSHTQLAAGLLQLLDLVLQE